jgi:hypothetical protein
MKWVYDCQKFNDMTQIEQQATVLRHFAANPICDWAMQRMNQQFLDRFADLIAGAKDYSNTSQMNQDTDQSAIVPSYIL